VFCCLSSCVGVSQDRANNRMWPGHTRTQEHVHVHLEEQMSPVTDWLDCLLSFGRRPTNLLLLQLPFYWGVDSTRVVHAMHDNFPGALGGFQAVFQGVVYMYSYVYSTVHSPTRSHVNFMQFVMFYVEGLWCYAWESQNDRLQFIQFILLSQTFVSASVPHFASLSLFPSHAARMCVLLTNWWNNFRSV